MKLEEIIKRNYQYAQECIESSIEYISGGDCIHGINPEEEAGDIIHIFKKLEKANKEGVLLEDN